MKIRTAPIILLLASGCNQSGNVGAENVIVEDGWAAREKATIQSSCKQTIIQSNKFTMAYAETYCQCIFESIYPRWSYAELQQNEASITEALGKEGILAECLQSAEKTQSDKLSQATKEAGMPEGIFGVRLGASIDDAKAIRPNLKESNGHLEEIAEWNGKKFNVSYEVSPFSLNIILISLERKSNRDFYMATNSELSSEFGQLSTPSSQGTWLLRSERTAGGVNISHSLSDEGGGYMKERIMLSRASN